MRSGSLCQIAKQICALKRLPGNSAGWPGYGWGLPIAFGNAQALVDLSGRDTTVARRAVAAARLDGLLGSAGFPAIGGTPLFRLAVNENSARLHVYLASKHILMRKFSDQNDWLCFGLPGAESDWLRLEKSMADQQ